MEDYLTLYGTTHDGNIGLLLGCTVFSYKNQILIIASAAEIIEFVLRNRTKTRDLNKWKEKCTFKLICSNKDNDEFDLEFCRFVIPDVPKIKNIISNLYINRHSLTVLGYSDDSSRNSTRPDPDNFMKKSIGVAILRIRDNELCNKIRCVNLTDENIKNSTCTIGTDVILYGSGLSIYTEEIFHHALDKGCICQIIGDYEGYVCNMTPLPTSQCCPIWEMQTDKLIGIKLPVFVDPKNFYQYSFILSLKSLTQAIMNEERVSIGRIEDNLFDKVSKSIVLIQVKSSLSNKYGTGVIVHPDGYILTNKHVVEGEKGILINKTLNAKVVCISKGLYDLALLKIESNEVFPYLTIEKKRIHSGTDDEYYSTGYGLWVITEQPAFFKGYIRKMIYHTDISKRYRCQFIAHSCETFNGGSGGPIINSNGKIVGINYQNILYKYESYGKTQNYIISKFGVAIANEVYEEIVDLLFNSSINEEDKLHST